MIFKYILFFINNETWVTICPIFTQASHVGSKDEVHTRVTDHVTFLIGYLCKMYILTELKRISSLSLSLYRRESTGVGQICLRRRVWKPQRCCYYHHHQLPCHHQGVTHSISNMEEQDCTLHSNSWAWQRRAAIATTTL